MVETKQEKREYLKQALSEVKMVDAGIKEKMNDNPVQAVSNKKGYVEYPKLYLNAKNAPFLKGYDVGDKCQIVIDGEITGHTLNNYEDSEERENFDIKIKKIGLISKE